MSFDTVFTSVCLLYLDGSVADYVMQLKDFPAQLANIKMLNCAMVSWITSFYARKYSLFAGRQEEIPERERKNICIYSACCFKSLNAKYIMFSMSLL